MSRGQENPKKTNVIMMWGVSEQASDQKADEREQTICTRRIKMKIVKNSLKYKWKFLFLLCNWLNFMVTSSFYFKPVKSHSSGLATAFLDHSKFMNENSTIFYSTLINANTTQSPLTNFTANYRNGFFKDETWWCSCATELDEAEMKTVSRRKYVKIKWSNSHAWWI